MVKGRTPTSKRPSKKRKLSVSPDEDEISIAETMTRPHSRGLHVLVDVEPLRADLLRWYDQVHENRAMPWRKPFVANATPAERAQRAYEVWVSEIMLQQTQVATVIPYYNRWMERFPTIRHLAVADIDTVNGLWKGLGYYSRAARLLSGAQKAVSDFGGRLPADVKKIEKEIPGIGRYSAGAICSIAYGLCVPVLDGNVHRLLSRVLALHAPPKAKKTLDLLWSGAEAMVTGSDRPGDVNQALIELGSTVCKVRDPACKSCPLKGGCGAYKECTGTTSTDDLEDLCDWCEPPPAGRLVTRFPMKVIKKKSREETDAVYIIEWVHNDVRWFILSRRPEGGLLAGLYEFPTLENIDMEVPHPDAILVDILAWSPGKHTAAAANSGGQLRIKHIRHIGEVVHVFSHIRKTYQIQWVVLEGGDLPPLFSGGSGHTAKKKKIDESIEEPNGSHVKWVREAEVPKANIGTGVLNVWKKANAFWKPRGEE